jgi:hypothetical protein
MGKTSPPHIDINSAGRIFLQAQPRKDTEDIMEKEKKERLVWVKDSSGNEYVCPINALKDPSTLSEEEKARCVDVAAPRGLVSPL